uniref:H15 domain-containing protein n=1 Tax=Tetraodon nigroviridis TaxID=99883 RepID=H3BXV4_TETNG
PHPSTAIMVKEALKALDSRKGASSQAIQNYIKLKYPTVDAVRLKHLVRGALKKGIESGALVRPANSTITTGATGRFRLAPKLKEPKPKSENVDPNGQKEPKPKDEAKKPPKAGGKKKEAGKEGKPPKDSKPPKTSEEDEKAGTSKVAPAASPAGKAKVTKTAKAGSAAPRKTAKKGRDAAAAKTTGKGGKKAADFKTEEREKGQTKNMKIKGKTRQS